MKPSQSRLRRNELIPMKHVSWAWLIVSEGFGGHCFLFIWLCQVLVVTHGIFDLHCSM